MDANRAIPLEPTPAEMIEMARVVTGRAVGFIEALPGRRTNNVIDTAASAEQIRGFLETPPEQGTDLTTLLGRLDKAMDHAIETGGPGLFAGTPGGGIYSSALAEFYTRAINRYGTLAAGAPLLTALEEGVLRWIAEDVLGLPTGSSGIFTTGGSMANLLAVVTARQSRLGEDIENGMIYVTAQSHYSVAKAAHIAGIKRRNIRVVPHDSGLRMNVAAAEAMICEDRRLARHPFLLVATAGTTDTGAIDPLPEMAALARRENLWFHVDAAYGGFFRLTERGRQRLAGTELADSVTVDPHKSLFLPFGTGALVVRDPATLSGHEGTAPCLQDVHPRDELPDYASLGLEQSREVRGLRVWLPLQLHGVSAFREALNEKLDLAEYAYEKLSLIPNLELPWRPQLSIVAFRVRPRGTSADAVAEAEWRTRRLLDRINAGGRVLIYSTNLQGRQTARVCILAHRTHADRIAEALDIIAAGVAAD